METNNSLSWSFLLVAKAKIHFDKLRIYYSLFFLQDPK